MRKFGLIGYPLSHSFSQEYFTEKFRNAGITDCEYEVYPLEDLGQLPSLLYIPGLEGLNVTIPYKEKVICFLEGADELVQSIKACNCLKINQGRFYGYNTDAIGFEESLVKKLAPHHDQALILGNGGAAKAVEYVVRKLGIAYRFVSRHPRPESNDLDYDELTEATIDSHTLIINTTPLGMSPHIRNAPVIPYKAVSSRHYLFDLIYNPEKTVFLQEGEARGAVIQNGFDMLIRQAEESWKIWNA